ncbi:MAG: parallel beta-helix repeat protein [Saprospiraceae bacterium]|jgi:parallel beta-helix repeat protein
MIACKQEIDTASIEVNTDVYNEIQEKLIDAKAGDIIEIPEGVFEFDRPLSLDGIPNVTIKGAGMNKTILSFKKQVSGAEGLKVTADSVTIVGLTIQDTKGDAIKLQDCNGVTIRDVKTTWTDGAKGTNGGYGLYPVASRNVLIENCEASYASDAGIYVGQSENVIVQNSYAHHNVAGIEIENCKNAIVRKCKAENNTGGILVFDLPDLPAGNGHTCTITENEIIDNNLKNFSPEGNMVAIVPPGSGIILLAAKNTNVFKNNIKGHKTLGVAIASFYLTQRKWEDKSYDPFTHDISIHDNVFERKGGITVPDMSKEFGKMISYYCSAKQQDIVYDGIFDDKKSGTNPMNLCINESNEDLRFTNVDAGNDFENIQKDIAVYNCTLDALPEVIFGEKVVIETSEVEEINK